MNKITLLVLLKCSIALSSVCILSTSCTSVSFYDGVPGEDNKTGLRFYNPKPYLLVTRSGDGGKIVGVEKVFLPDTSKPQYAVHNPGWGKTNFSFDFDNGILKAFKNDFDGEGDEAVTSVGSLATSTGSLLKAMEEANNLKKLKNESGKAKISEGTQNLLRQASDNVKQANNQNEKLEPKPAPVASLSGIITGLESIVADSMTATGEDNLDSLIKRSQTIQGSLNSLILSLDKEKAKGIIPSLKEAATDVKSAIAAMEKSLPKEMVPELPTFELYEVLINPSGTILRRVELPTKR